MGSTGRSKAFSVKAFAIIIALVLSLCWPSETVAYAVLAHEAIIDSLWDTNIEPFAVEAFSRCDATRNQRSARLCIRWGHYPGHGVLPARKSYIADEPA